MVRDTAKYEQVIQFRKRGFTLAEIAKICEISKSTASIWLKDKAFSDTVTTQNKKRAGTENAKRLKLFNKARVSERAIRYKEIVRSAEIEFKHYKNNPLFVAGLMLYVGEGDTKHRSLIRVANSNMDVHQIFIRFALEFLGVDKGKLKFWLLLYPDQNEAMSMKKWRKATGIPYSQFHKNQVIKGKSAKHTLQYGVGNTIIGSTVLKYKLNRWIELILKDLKK